MFGIDGYVPKYKNYYAYDVAKAKSLLAAAGYPNGFKLDLATIPVGYFLPLAQGVAKYFGDIGVTVNIRTADLASYVGTVAGGTYPVFIVQGGGLIAPLVQVLAHPGTVFDNFGGTGWSDPVLDSLFKKSQSAANPTSFNQAIMTRYTTQAYSLPIVSTQFYAIGAKNIGGVPNTPNGNTSFAGLFETGK
jgi:peptide/nickel transport system substrate-binding protein